MDIEIFTLCDAATDQMGKLNILGAFDAIYTRSFPYKHHSCAVALRIRFSKIEQGQHKMRLNFVDEDGKDVLPPINGEINIKMDEQIISLARNMILNINGITFSKPGHYSIDLAIDGRRDRSLPVFVRQVNDTKKRAE